MHYFPSSRCWPCSVAILTLLVALLTGPVQAQKHSPPYQPSTSIPGGSELLIVFITASTCSVSNIAGFDETIKEMKLLLAERASDLGFGITIRGVALDWDAATGVNYLLERFGTFDEVAAGRNWYGVDAVEYIWRPESIPAIPIVIVRRRTVTPGPDSTLRFSVDETLLFRQGLEDISQWIEAGTPLDF